MGGRSVAHLLREQIAEFERGMNDEALDPGLRAALIACALILSREAAQDRPAHLVVAELDRLATKSESSSDADGPIGEVMATTGRILRMVATALAAETGVMDPSAGT